MTRPRHFYLAALLLCCVACGVSMQDGPVVVDDDNVPFALLDPSTTTSMPAPAESTTSTVTVCFHQGPAVVSVERAESEPSVSTALRIFLRGPSADEAANGLSTAVFDPSLIAGARVAAGVATVSLSSTFADATGATQLDFIVELVCTLTAQPGIGQVRFELRGERIEIPRGDGSLTAEAVSRDDYRGLIR
jgi:spore germination protein GerM